MSAEVGYVYFSICVYYIVVCRLDGSIYVHVLKYRRAEVSCGLQLSYNIRKPNDFLNLVWNVFGPGPLPITPFSHFVG